MDKISNNLTKWKQWRLDFSEHKYLIFTSLGLLILAFILDYVAGNYVMSVNAISVKDLILDNIPVLNLNWIYLYGGLLVMLVLILYPFIYDIKKFHELIIMLSFLIMVRALFTTFTHLSNPADALNFPVPKFLFFLDFKNDLFFSGHTAVPFLGFLLFKDKIKYFFLASSFIMAFAVLSMHIHYTIDVMSAFFITYCVYKIGEAFFNRIDYNKSKYRRIFEI